MDKMRERVLELVGDYWDTAWDEARSGESQADRANEILNEIKAALTPSPWIPCAERLPTEADADIELCVWGYNPRRQQAVRMKWDDADVFGFTHWKPTGLVRPETPELATIWSNVPLGRFHIYTKPEPKKENNDG